MAKSFCLTSHYFKLLYSLSRYSVSEVSLKNRLCTIFDLFGLSFVAVRLVSSLSCNYLAGALDVYQPLLELSGDF